MRSVCIIDQDFAEASSAIRHFLINFIPITNIFNTANEHRGRMEETKQSN